MTTFEGELVYKEMSVPLSYRPTRAKLLILADEELNFSRTHNASRLTHRFPLGFIKHTH